MFEDDFEFLDPSCGAPADDFYVEDGVLVLNKANYQWQRDVTFALDRAL